MENNITSWYDTLWKTRSARFNSFRRIKRVYNTSSVALFLASIYIISINLLLLSDMFTSDNADKNVTIANVVLSIFILALGLYLKGQNYQKQYIDYHNSGKKINSLYGKLKSIKNEEAWNTDISEIIQEYNTIIEYEDLNHSDFDYKKVLISESKEGFSGTDIAYNIYKYNIEPYIIYAILILVPPILILLSIK